MADKVDTLYDAVRVLTRAVRGLLTAAEYEDLTKTNS